MALRLVPVPEKKEVIFDSSIGSIKDNLAHKSGQLGYDLRKNGFSKETLLSWLSTEQARIDIDNQPIVFETVDAAVSHVVDIHKKYPDRLSNTILCRGEIALDCIASLKSHPSLHDSRLSYGPVKLGAPFSIMTSWDRTTSEPLPNTDAMIHQSIVTDIRSKIRGVTSRSANEEISDLEYSTTTTIREDDFPLLTDKVFDYQDEKTGDNELDQIAKIADELLVSPGISQNMPQEDVMQKKNVFSSIGAWFTTLKQKTKSFFSRLKS